MPIASRKVLASIKSGVVSGGLSWRSTPSTNLSVDTSVRAKGADILAYKQRIALERDTFWCLPTMRPL